MMREFAMSMDNLPSGLSRLAGTGIDGLDDILNGGFQRNRF